MLCNPSLTAEINDKIGTDWHLDLTGLRALEKFVSDPSFVRNVAQIKQENKERFAAWVERTHGLKLNTSECVSSYLSFKVILDCIETC